jgi:hypothetical protein
MRKVGGDEMRAPADALDLLCHLVELRLRA